MDLRSVGACHVNQHRGSVRAFKAAPTRQSASKDCTGPDRRSEALRTRDGGGIFYCDFEGNTTTEHMISRLSIEQVEYSAPTPSCLQCASAKRGVDLRSAVAYSTQHPGAICDPSSQDAGMRSLLWLSAVQWSEVASKERRKDICIGGLLLHDRHMSSHGDATLAVVSSQSV